MSLIKGMHHVALRVQPEIFDKTVAFYRDVLELPVLRTWKGACMLSTGNSIIEVLQTPDALPTGVVEHFALATDSVDAITEKVRALGLPVTIEPKDVEIQSNPVLPVHLAFFKGIAGETIELFCEK